MLCVGLATFSLGIGHAAQLDGGGDTGQRDVCLRKMLGQLHPWQRTGFVERIAANILGQQCSFSTQACRQRAQAGPVLRQCIQQHHRFEITVQVQHHIGVARMLQKQATKAFELRWRSRQVVEDVEHGAANDGHVGLAILA